MGADEQDDEWAAEHWSQLSALLREDDEDAEGQVSPSPHVSPSPLQAEDSDSSSEGFDDGTHVSATQQEESESSQVSSTSHVSQTPPQVRDEDESSVSSIGPLSWEDEGESPDTLRESTQSFRLSPASSPRSAPRPLKRARQSPVSAGTSEEDTDSDAEAAGHGPKRVRARGAPSTPDDEDDLGSPGLAALFTPPSPSPSLDDYRLSEFSQASTDNCGCGMVSNPVSCAVCRAEMLRKYPSLSDKPEVLAALRAHWMGDSPVRISL